MKKLSLVLALCAFVAAPAFANEHEGKTEEAKTAAAEHNAPVSKKDMKKKKKKMAKKGAAETEAPAEAPAHE